MGRSVVGDSAAALASSVGVASGLSPLPVGTAVTQTSVEQLTAVSLFTQIGLSAGVPLAIGIFLLAATPDIAERGIEIARVRTFGAALIGVGATIGVLILMALSSLVPPVMVAILIVYGLFVALGQTVGAIALGTSLLARFYDPNPDRWLGLVTGVGVFIVAALVPVVGWLLNLVVSMVGMGTCIAFAREQ